jgi:hypothetical protein
VDAHMNKFDNVKRFIYHMISTASKSMKKLSRKNDIVHKKKIGHERKESGRVWDKYDEKYDEK